MKIKTFFEGPGNILVSDPEKKVQQAKRGSLMKKFFKINKFLLILLLCVLVSSVILIPQYVNPKPAEAIVLVDDIIFWTVFALMCAVVLGIEYLDVNSAKDVGQSGYNHASPELKEEVQDYAQDGIDNGVIDVSNEAFTEIREWGADHVSDTGGIAPFILDYYGTGLSSPWLPASVGIYDYVLDVGDGREITLEVFQEAYALGSLHLIWTESDTDIEYKQTGNYWLAYNNDVSGVGANNGNVCTERWFTDINTDVKWYYPYSLRGTIFTWTATQLQPKFILIGNVTSGNVTAAITYHAADGKYFFKPIAKAYEGTYYGGIENRYVITDDKVEKAVIIKSIFDDPDYDFVIDGHRYIPYTDQFGNVIGLTPDQILAGDWAVVDAITSGENAITDELENIDVRLGAWEVWLAKMAALDGLTFSETGALEVSISEPIEVTLETTAPYELDIPQTEFSIPTIELLSTKFPFCIPFDLYNSIANLVTEPEAPEFNINFPANIFYANADMSLDFSVFENLAVVIRWIILLGFVISLIILTRKLIRG